MNRKTQIAFLMILIVAGFATLAFVIWPTIYVTDQYTTGGQVTAPPQSAPDQVVQDFYTWYLGYAERANPLVNKAYRDHNALTPDFVSHMDEFTSQPMMFDPILCAQDVPTSVSTKDLVVDGSTATVRVETSFPGHAFDVKLAQEGKGWQITDVICVVP